MAAYPRFACSQNLLKKMFKRLISTAKLNPIESEILFPRLERHYFETIYEDLMIMNYDHKAHNDSILQNDKDWNLKFDDKLIDQVYLTRVQDLPIMNTSICTNLLTKIPDQTKTKMKKKLKNPIDYTTIPKYEFYPPPPPREFEPFLPIPSRVPALKQIDLSIWTEDAVGNKYMLFN